MAAIFADEIFICISFNENVWISNNISLKYVPQGLVHNKHIIGSDNGLSPNRRQDIIRTNEGKAAAIL